MPGQASRDESADGDLPCPASPPAVNHDMLRLALIDAGQRVAAAVEEPDRFPAARDGIARFCYAELLSHLEADEHWLLEARHCTEGRLIAEAIRTEARAMTAAVHELADATDPCQAVAAIRVLHALLAAHAHHEQLLLAPGG